MKDRLIEILRSVSITDKTYPEYVEALAMTLLANEYSQAPNVERNVAREIFAEIGELINEYLDGRSYRHEFCTKVVELKKKYTQEKHRCYNCKHCANANWTTCEACTAGSRWESEDSK